MRPPLGLAALTAAAVALAPAAPLALSPSRGEGDGPLHRIVQDGKWGFVDSRGAIVIPPSFDRAGHFSEGLAAVQRGATHGYVDARGALALVPTHSPAGPVHRPFSEGLAVVRVGAEQGYIDREGRLAFGRTFGTAGDFSGGYALVCGAGAGCGYIDRRGEAVLGPGFRGGAPVKDGIACAVLMRMMGRTRVALYRLPDRTPLGEYDGCGQPSEGLVAVQVDGRWGYVDLRGKGVLAPAWPWAGEFSGGLAPVRDEASGLCGYVRTDGTFAIPARFRSCGPFSGDRARVDLAREPWDPPRTAFVDRAGAPVVVGLESDPPFDAAADFVGGLAAVGSGGEPYLAGAVGPRLGYVDPSGRLVWRPRH